MNKYDGQIHVFYFFLILFFVFSFDINFFNYYISKTFFVIFFCIMCMCVHTWIYFLIDPPFSTFTFLFNILSFFFGTWGVVHI